MQRERERERERQTERETERETQRERQRERQRESMTHHECRIEWVLVRIVLTAASAPLLGVD